jgi:hypothetical protein
MNSTEHDPYGLEARESRRIQDPVESVMLVTTQISTFAGQVLLTRASGFFFRRDERLHLVTSRHVLSDEPNGHAPDRIELLVHTDGRDLSKHTVLSCLLFENGKAAWRQARDAAGGVDVAVLEIDQAALPGNAQLRWFTPDHLLAELQLAEIGAPLVLLGYPLGFHDTVHHLPVARHAIIASAFGVRFQRQGYFLTDGRAHRGSSGSPVLMKVPAAGSHMPWKLLGVHSSRMDMGSRDAVLDESLGLNCAWYADILMTLTNDEHAQTPEPVGTGHQG